MDPTSDEQSSALLSHRLSQRQMEKAPEGLVGNYREQQHEYSPEHIDRRLPSPRPQQQHAENHDLPPPLPYGTTTPPTTRFLAKAPSDRLENGAPHVNAKTPSHVGGRHLSPPPHPDTGNDGVEAAGDGDGEDEEDEDEDEDDMYTDEVNQDHLHTAKPVAAGTETETVPTVSTGGGHTVEPSAADIHPQDEPEGYEHGITDKSMQKEPTRDVSGDDTGVEADTPSGGRVLAHGSTEEVHAA